MTVQDAATLIAECDLVPTLADSYVVAEATTRAAVAGRATSKGGMSRELVHRLGAR